MERLKTYIIESFDELKNKMTWPTWENLQQTTGIVLLASVVLALVISLMDGASNFVMSTIYGVK